LEHPALHGPAAERYEAASRFEETTPMVAAAALPALRLEIDGPIAWIVADNPARMNAFTAAMWEALPRLVSEADAAADVRVIVLRGAGERAFSAGADISEFESARTGASAETYDRLSDEAFTALYTAAKPTLAMIHGFCLGGGLGLAASCDLRLADDKAEFAIPAARLGIGYNARWMCQLLALAAAPAVKELVFTGWRFPAADALRMGLVNRVVAPARLEAETRTLAAAIAANAPLTVRAAKLTIDELRRRPENPDLAALDAAVEACFQSEDYAEGRRAFLEKRKPEFKGC
jgi:enoyl-CoA hydratase/carnithine racemase